MYQLKMEHGMRLLNMNQEWLNRSLPFHQNHENEITSLIDQDFGVDSGQFGIFDASTYIGDTDRDQRKWYMAICNCHTSDGNTIPDGSGFVSGTGYGDGSYIGHGAFINDELVKFSITFLEDEEEEEDYYDEDDEDENSDEYDF